MPQLTPNTIQRVIPEEENVIEFKKSAHNIGSFGYKGVNIEVFSCPIHNNELLACVSGLGHTLNMLYLIESEYHKTMTPVELLVIAYNDFKDFIVYEREEEHLALH